MEGTTTATPTFFYIENYFASNQNGSKKPSKNHIYCPDCGRHKALFRSREEAELFMNLNRESIIDETGYAPVRAYYCDSCRGWHVTSQTQEMRAESTEVRKKLGAIHKKATARKNNTMQTLNQVERYISIAVENFKKEKIEKAKRFWRKAFQLFERTMKSEFFMVRKLVLFNQLTLCQELWTQ